MSRTLQKCQEEVDAWIKQHAVGYWSIQAIYIRLGSEMGELAKEINHTFGPLKKKKEERNSSVQEECGDILFTIICMMNAQGWSMDKAFQKSMDKCYGRDKDRFEKKVEPKDGKEENP